MNSSKDWQEFRLGDLTTWASGTTPSKQNPSFWGGEIPWISGTVMRSKNLNKSELYLTKEGLDNKGKLVEINVFCELEVDDGNKYWTKLRRTTGDSDAGVSKFTFLGGTNSFNKLKGKECTYAVSYFKNKIFGNNQCQISDELFAELKK